MTNKKFLGVLDEKKKSENYQLFNFYEYSKILKNTKTLNFDFDPKKFSKKNSNIK